MFVVKIHTTYRNVVAICDNELLGKKFEEGNKQLEISNSFFGGIEKTPEEVAEIIKYQFKEDSSFNIVGKRSVKLALELGVIEEGGIGKIQGIPFALILM